jgi:hypothetical protein
LTKDGALLLSKLVWFKITTFQQRDEADRQERERPSSSLERATSANHHRGTEKRQTESSSKIDWLGKE